MNSTRRNSVTFLRLVEPSVETPSLTRSDFVRPSWRSTLFANDHPNLLTFVNFERTSESDFLTLLTVGRPRFVIDLRVAPRFDVGTLNRRLVFSLFSQAGIRYVDMSGHLSITDRRDAKLNPRMLMDSLRTFAFRSDRPVQGSVVFLVDAPQFEEPYIRQLLEELPSAHDHGWDVLRIPAARSATRGDRDTEKPRPAIFISHANPQDNAFVAWLATRLTVAGYRVWTDITKLSGGEEFWDTIEDVVRHHASKAIIVLSRVAQTKKNVLDEINLAVSVERSAGIEGFVIPLRIDDLPFDHVRANLARKNIIDFKDNWATGLTRLLEALERDDVPRSKNQQEGKVLDWAIANFRVGASLVQEPETLISNWLTISRLPEAVVLYDVAAPNDRIREIARSLPYPNFQYLRLIGSFAEAADLEAEISQSAVLVERYRIATAAFAGGWKGLPISLTAREAQNILLHMLRQAWDIQMRRRGLLPFEMASGALTWFFPKGLIDGDKISFTDSKGKRRRKALVGWSGRRQIFWHLGIEARATLGRNPRFVLKQHIIFTEDGRTPLGSKERMHTLRRRFCRSWWNDRWRDLLLAYMSWLSPEDKLALNVGASATVELAGLLQVQSPISANESKPSEPAVYEELQDELDNDEDDLDVTDGSGIPGSDEFFAS